MNHDASAPAVRLTGVEFEYPDGTPALRGVDLEVGRGERVAVLGPNGAGKSTLALHLNGILRPRRGSVEVDGLPVEEPNLREVRRRVGLVLQDPDDQLFMPTVRDDVAFGPANLGFRGDELTARVEAALERTGMAGHAGRAPHHLSAGERRRVALATVLSMDPTVLVLDEPSSGLDPRARRELAELILELGLTTLVVTHDLLYALHVCDRAVILDGGVVVADGAVEEVLADEALLHAHRLELPYGVAIRRGPP